MHQLYAKHEVSFAVFWIVLYCVLTIPIRGYFGDESIWMLIALGVIAGGITAFIKFNGLEEKYGLWGWPKDTKKYLFLIPMWILVTGNLWGGITPAYQGISLLFAILSMFLVGYVEEIIFRGLLFKALIPKDGVVVAITVSAVTFGIGHIVNLFAGQANLETIMQVFFAVAWGFLFTMVFYKTGKLMPCIIAHGLVDVFSKFLVDTVWSGWAYMGATIVISTIYCIYLAKLPVAEHNA